jgi:hypothetical protein
MGKHWLSARGLAEKLGSGEIGNREVAYLMIANLVLATVIYYGAFTTANPPWTALSLWEGVMTAVIVIYGMIRCYEAAGGDKNDRFAADFNSLSFPIWLWITVTVWPAYWLGLWMYRSGIRRLAFDDYELASSIARYGERIEWLWTAAAIIGAQIWYFWWLRRAMARAWSRRNAR